MLIFLIGFMGTGKTHWGRVWSARYGMDFIDLDDAIEASEGQNITAIFKNSGEIYFREKEAAALRRLSSLKNTIIASGGGTPCFHDNMDWMNDHGLTIYLETDPAVLAKRISTEIHQRPLVKDVPVEKLQAYIEALLQERIPIYQKAKYTFSTEHLLNNSLDQLLHRTD